MNHKQINNWLDNPELAVQELIADLGHENHRLPEIQSYNIGEAILHEGKQNNSLYLVVCGVVELIKINKTNNSVSVTQLKTGAVFGVLSFFTDALSLTSAITQESSTILKLSREEVYAYLDGHSRLAQNIRQMIIANLLSRYHQVVDLNLQISEVNDSLKSAMDNLKMAHNRLVHQEKMATLGQLVAGIAHEINNPAAALQSALRSLTETFPKIIINSRTLKFLSYGQNGRDNSFSASIDERNFIREEYPSLSTSQQRLILGMEMSVQSEFKSLSPTDQNEALTFYDIGLLIRGVNSSSSRIVNIIKSLKSYSRQDANENNHVNIFEGINDTLQILASRFKLVEVKVEIDKNLEIFGNAAEINQVWTNIIVNACDAMADSGTLLIRAFNQNNLQNKKVQVEFHDNGKGISPPHLPLIFNPNFTTRNSSGNFGLGLGLSITKDIVIKHNGTISAGVSEILSGAKFIVAFSKI